MALDTGSLRNRLKLRGFASERQLLDKHPEAARFYEKIGLRPGKIREHAAKLLASGVLASNLLLPATPILTAPPVSQMKLSGETAAAIDLSYFAKNLQATLPPVGNWQLSPSQKQEISDQIFNNYDVHAVAELEGNKLNNQYGRMGAEQHLPRYPGDTAQAHGELVEKGITPGLGGWGYVPDFNVEKWYVAVQTLYLPDWNTRTKYLVDWYKFRRVVVVNPANGKALVAAVADAGPADWTGKHFGGSPEVMAYLGINVGMQNHPVVLFFLDDPGKKVPLGPLEYNKKRHG